MPNDLFGGGEFCILSFGALRLHLFRTAGIGTLPPSPITSTQRARPLHCSRRVTSDSGADGAKGQNGGGWVPIVTRRAQLPRPPHQRVSPRHQHRGVDGAREIPRGSPSRVALPVPGTLVASERGSPGGAVPGPGPVPAENRLRRLQGLLVQASPELAVRESSQDSHTTRAGRELRRADPGEGSEIRPRVSAGPTGHERSHEKRVETAPESLGGILAGGEARMDRRSGARVVPVVILRGS